MNQTTKAYLAIAFLSVAWGTTYLAIRVGVEHYPAFLFAGLRQVIAGTLLGLFALIAYKKADLSAKVVLTNMLIGFLMITMGNGIVSYVEKTVPSGVAALICTMMPLNAVMLNILINKNEKLNLVIITGITLAIAGVALIFRDNLADLANPAYLGGMIAIYFGTISWAYGSIKSKTLSDVKNPIFNAAMQLFFGGLFLLVVSPFADSFDNFEPFQPKALMAMAYLVVVGSFLAFTAYMFALKVLPVGVVTLYAYVNPLAAVILGYFLMNEKLTWLTGLAFAGIVSGVYLVNAGYRKQKALLITQQNKTQIEELDLVAEQA